MPSEYFELRDRVAFRAFFVDSENGVETLMEGFGRLDPSDLIIVFHRGSLSNKVQEQLSLSPAQVEFIECLDPGIKNSMDVQIIVELSIRLMKGAFQEAFIVSRDKGYMPAIHYLEKQFSASGCQLGLANSIGQAIDRSISKTLDKIDGVKTLEELEGAFVRLIGERRGHQLMKRMAELFYPGHSLLEERLLHDGPTVLNHAPLPDKDAGIICQDEKCRTFQDGLYAGVSVFETGVVISYKPSH